MERRRSLRIKVGDIFIGNGLPIVVQSMTKTSIRDLEKTLSEIEELEEVGCELVRIAIRDEEEALNISKIKKRIKIPIVADIHFNPEVALIALKEGVDKLRLNPGNIKDKKKIKEIVLLAKEMDIPIRIGVNSGSLDKRKYPFPTAENLVSSALDYINFFESLNFYKIVISLKACDVQTTIKAYRLMAERVKYPFHIGITEAGIGEYGIIKSAVGCGIITFLGLADTVRVSLTAPSKDEVIVAYQILKSLGLREYGPEVISCPTCGRAKIDLIKVVEYFNKELQRRYSSRILKEIRAFKIALMGCEVNGPGEASFADIGVAFGRDRGYLFKFGKIIEKGSLEEILKALLREVDKLIVVGRRDEG